MSGPVETELKALIVEARPRLWRAYLGARGMDGADDATAEALAWAWENGQRLLTTDNPIGYLYRVGLSRTVPKPGPTRLPSPAEVRIPDVEPALIPALMALTELQRSAVWLVHGCGWTYAEVADALDIGRSTVGTHVSRALTALRDRLEVETNV